MHKSSCYIFICICKCKYLLCSSFPFLWLQYYEMSYGLNIEMHKQVRIWIFVSFFFCIIIVVKIFNKHDKKCSSLDWRLCKTCIVSFKVQKPTCMVCTLRMQRPRFSSVLPSNAVSMHYHDWLLFMCFCATSADCKRIPSYLINGCKPMRCACVLSAGGDREEIERNLCSGVALPVSRGQAVWFIYDTLYSDSQPH